MLKCKLSLLQQFRAKKALAQDLAKAQQLADEHLAALAREKARVMAVVEVNQKQQEVLEDWQQHAGAAEAGQQDLAAELETERKARLGAERYIEFLRTQKAEVQERYEHLKELHSDRVRVCSISFDPVRLTARLRAIEPSLRAEWDGSKITVYSDVRLIQSKLNAVILALEHQVDLT